MSRPRESSADPIAKWEAGARAGEAAGDPGESQVTLEPREALDVAMWLHQSGRLEEADRVYGALLLIDPYNPDAMNYLGVLRHQLGRTDDALALLRASVQNEPRNPHAWSNLGNVLRDSGDEGAAVEAYQRAAELDPRNAAAHNNLGVVLKELDRLEEAEASYRRALEADPEHADAWRNLGHVLTRLGRPVEALDAYTRAVALRPEGAPYRNLSYSLYRLGQTERAVAVVREWLAKEPENPVARHLLAAFSGEDVPSRASDSFVREVFDGFAKNYDGKLKHLQYRGPELVASALKRTMSRGPAPEDGDFLAPGGFVPAPEGEHLEGASSAHASRGRLRVLDAGCGTGLCAEVLRPLAAHLSGLDLSPEMLLRAETRGLYDELVASELTGFLQGKRDAFDLVVSADTLCYFGDLEAVLGGAAKALAPGGRLVFTLEDASDRETPTGFRLEPHGRYSHRESYVREVLAASHFVAVEILRGTLRMEAGEPVTGLVVTARRPRPVRKPRDLPEGDPDPRAEGSSGT